VLVVIDLSAAYTDMSDKSRNGRTTIGQHDNYSLQILVEQLFDRVYQLMFVLLCLTLELVSFFSLFLLLKVMSV
jgi:hypothetical protein